MKKLDSFIPINKQTSEIISKCNDQQREFKRSDIASSMVKFPTIQFSGLREHDLTGRKCGRFVIIGCAAYKRKNRRANTVRWVVRCSCGRYQMMTSKGAKNDNPGQMCVECRRTQR